MSQRAAATYHNCSENINGGIIMKKILFSLVLGVSFLCTCHVAMAHFGMLIPSDTMIMQGDPRTISLVLSFSHPFESVGMELVKPQAFGVVKDGKKQDLLGDLKQTKVMGHMSWKADYTIKRPGVYVFYMLPSPYWEPAEDCFIVHMTKTVVAAFGDEDGWDQEIGLKTEIVSLSRPFGLYAGNVFQGIVKLDGNPVPFAEVEIEYYNQEKKTEAPTEYMVTQTIKADQNGVFTYAAPKAGWWGFAALNTSEEKIRHDGEEKDVELGAVLWVKFLDWKGK
jgi:cobalt/nickel transport protein